MSRSGHALTGWGAVPPARRALLWKVMPLAAILLVGLSVAERVWWRPPFPPSPPQIDTTLAAVRGPDPAGGAVRLEPDSAPAGGEAAAGDTAAAVAADGLPGLSADRSALARVRDDTMFREADLDAWLQTWQALREAGPAGSAAADPAAVSFAELFNQPRSFRGRLVRLTGTLHRVERLRAPANNYGIEQYWQGWLEPAGGPASPIVLQCLELPAGMPVGMKIHEPVDVTGYFFKRHAYAAADTVRVAPLVMALGPTWRPLPPPVSPGGAFAIWGLVPLVVIAGGVVVALWSAGRRHAGRRRPPPAVDVAAALGGFVPESPAESLRRLASGTEVGEPAPRAESPSP